MDERSENRDRDRSRTGRTSTSNRTTMESLSVEINRYPRDLLQRFMSSNTPSSEKDEEGEEDSEGIELNLGLSLGGKFGVDKTWKRKLTRSSSIAGSIPLIRENDCVDNKNTPPSLQDTPLMRTSSLPAEREEEWRKRKEMQSLRRLEAKRRRSEKRNLRGEVSLEDVNKGNLMGGWNVSKDLSFRGVLGGQQHGGSQSSVESHGGSSSRISEFENKQFQGSSSGGEARSSSNIQSLQIRSNHERVGSSGAGTSENASRSEMENASKSAEKVGKEIGNKSLEDMPCVFTKGDGPNGRRVDGILYKYGRGEEVRIMCICHGSFLSPAEFVKHAGGGDVEHPLKHIVIDPSGSRSL